jgi:phage/plasmid-like protein (TIGR03299 family)
VSEENTMSKETLEHLNTNTLIGFTDKRGNAWHYRADQQGDKPNHYTGAIPVPDVQRRLFHWHAESRALAVETPADLETMTHLDAQGEPVRWAPVERRQAICRSDDQTGSVLGIFAPGYAMHQYDVWLLTTVANLLDDDLAISSAGLLRGGAIAWVEVSVPDTITTPEGVDFRPNLLATTSFDGSIATTFKRTVTATVCDNTRQLALAEKGEEFKVKHTRGSTAQLAPAREALALVNTLADEFAAEVKELCATTVTDRQWATFLDAQVPITDQQGQPLTGRSLTMADKKRSRLDSLYRHDDRVSPWVGTAYGVMQAVSTYEHHDSAIRGVDRSERNMLRAVTGQFGQVDRSSWKTLSSVLAEAY